MSNLASLPFTPSVRLRPWADAFVHRKPLSATGKIIDSYYRYRIPFHRPRGYRFTVPEDTVSPWISRCPPQTYPRVRTAVRTAKTTVSPWLDGAISWFLWLRVVVARRGCWLAEFRDSQAAYQVSNLENEPAPCAALSVHVAQNSLWWNSWRQEPAPNFPR